MTTKSKSNRQIPPMPTEVEVETDNPYTITEEDLVDRQNIRPSKSKYGIQLFVALTISLGPVIFGLTLGWVNPKLNEQSLHSVNPLNNISNEEYANTISLLPCGCSVGMIPWSYALKKHGPKSVLVQSTICFFLFFLLINEIKFGDDQVHAFLGGFLSIPIVIAGEYLIADCVQKYYLNSMILFYSAAPLGYVMAFVIQLLFSKECLTVSMIAIVVVYTLLLKWVPESPVFLCYSGEEKAREALMWIQGQWDFHRSFRCVQKDFEIRRIDRVTHFHMLTKPVVIKGFLIACGLTFFEVFSGYYIFLFFNYLFWNEFPNGRDMLIKAIIFGVHLYVSNLVGNYIKYRLTWGVRKPLLFSTLLIALNLTILTITLYFQEHSKTDITDWNWVPTTAINFFIVSYKLGLNTCPKLLLQSYVPYEIYPLLRSIFFLIYWFQVFLLVKYFLVVASLTSYCIAFSILTIISYTSILYCYFVVIEIKNKTFTQIQLEIDGHTAGTRGSYRTRYFKS